MDGCCWGEALHGGGIRGGRLSWRRGSETGPGPQLVTSGKSTILSVDAHGIKWIESSE
jgi:hypothetical protein